MSKPPCSVEGCERKRYVRGWCITHYERWRNHGDVQAHIPHISDVAPIDRFLRSVDIGNVEECWEWRASRTPEGYGKFRANGRAALTHRFSYEHFVGPIPPGFHLDHLCRNRACCNPAHLEPVTCRENLLRGAGLPAINSKKVACLSGHPFDEANTRFNKAKNGRVSRACRACARIREQKKRDKRKAGKE